MIRLFPVNTWLTYAASAFLFLLTAPTPLTSPAVADVLLYDGSFNTTPNAQGWKFVTNPIIGSAVTQSAAVGVTTLDTFAKISEQGGYFSTFPILGSHPSAPTLDRTTGYSVRWDIQVLAEDHTSNNRAGFDVIVLSQDLKGIELAFWEDEIFALDDDLPTFSHSEGAMFDTTASLTRYDLNVLGGSYELFANGASILTGLLRDYSAFGFPYDTPSFIFLGDDTTSARARTSLARVSVTVPEPSSAATVLFLLLAMGKFSRRVSRW